MPSQAFGPQSSTLAGIVDQTAYLQPGFEYPSYGDDDQISPTTVAPNNNANFLSQNQQKRKEPPNPSSTKPSKKVKRVGPRSDSRDNVTNGNGDKDAEASKPKRVRTGCLTCRERHLKVSRGIHICASRLILTSFSATKPPQTATTAKRAIAHVDVVFD